MSVRSEVLIGLDYGKIWTMLLLIGVVVALTWLPTEGRTGLPLVLRRGELLEFGPIS